MSLFSFLKKKSVAPPVEELNYDIHSHLIPAIDDGVQSVDEGLAIIEEFESLGYEKLITTPHTMWGTYNNSAETILGGLEIMQEAISKAGLQITIEAASEYYLDEHFMAKLNKKEKLLSFGDQYVLVETGFINEPPELKEASFQLSMLGYKMVYAHPERYMYLLNNDKLLEELIDRDIVFQINAISLTGFYGKPVQKMAEKLIDMKAYGFVGSDCHNMGHANLMKEVRQSKYWNKLLQLDLLNNKL
mgnify:CR=1 FL=1